MRPFSNTKEGQVFCESEVGVTSVTRHGEGREVRCYPKTTRSSSLRQREQMHMASCLSSAAALFQRALHQRVHGACVGTSRGCVFARGEDMVELWAMLERRREMRRRRSMLLHHQLRAKAAYLRLRQQLQPASAVGPDAVAVIRKCSALR